MLMTLVFQRKGVIEIEKKLNRCFTNICKWFVNNRFRIYFGKDKTKCIHFGSKRKIKKVPKLNTTHKNIQIKQHSKYTNVGCILDETVSRESLALKVMNKINS